MGAINSAFNQAAGAAAGAALAIKHAKETEESKMYTAENAALVARNQASTAEAEANEASYEAGKEGGLLDQLGDANDDRIRAEKAYNKAVNRKNGSQATIFKKQEDLWAAQEAEKILKGKFLAIKDLQNRAAEQRAHAKKATELAEKAQQKYQSRWGIK